MKCKQALKMIPKFMNDRLDFDEMKEFIEHVEGCPECKEELTIEILVEEGLNSLESGVLFDLQDEYNRKLNVAQKEIKSNESLLRFYHMMIGLVIVGVFAASLLFVFMRG
ncbi:MAG: zf-HC2 domain-containing protein [Lachnospiraceae bacterium]|nr:zf-HC2 domain-containing protein [Lachnospiraceae bacterium]